MRKQHEALNLGDSGGHPVGDGKFGQKGFTHLSPIPDRVPQFAQARVLLRIVACPASKKVIAALWQRPGQREV